MQRNHATYGSGRHVRSSGGTAGIVAAVLILLGALFNACQDQPLDSTGISVIRDTITNVRHDTIVLNNLDTVIVTVKDTIIIEKRDTIITPEVRWDTVIRRDTIRDTITRHRIDTVTRIIYDTVEVPRNEIRYRKATLIYNARNDSLGLNGPLQKLNVDLTEWLQYKIVDSAGAIHAVGVSMSAPIPSQYRRFGVAALQAAAPFYLRGLAISIPPFRMGDAAGGVDTVPLNRHPYDWMSAQDRGGGIMITAQAGALPGFLQGWTGQVIEVALPTGGERFQSWGGLRISRINSSNRIIHLQIQGTIFVMAELNGRAVVERFEIVLELELGY